jgi:hypothetical protein
VNVFAIGFATLFMGIAGVLAVRGLVPAAVPVFYAAASVAAVIAYRLDKSAAGRNAWQTSERMLHFIAAMGGWPGALVAQEVFRHSLGAVVPTRVLDDRRAELRRADLVDVDGVSVSINADLTI